eukprot:PhF_6_TR7951/c2_g1_i1/m.12001
MVLRCRIDPYLLLTRPVLAPFLLRNILKDWLLNVYVWNANRNLTDGASRLMLQEMSGFVLRHSTKKSTKWNSGKSQKPLSINLCNGFKNPTNCIALENLVSKKHYGFYMNSASVTVAKSNARSFKKWNRIWLLCRSSPVLHEVLVNTQQYRPP